MPAARTKTAPQKVTARTKARQTAPQKAASVKTRATVATPRKPAVTVTAAKTSAKVAGEPKKVSSAKGSTAKKKIGPQKAQKTRMPVKAEAVIEKPARVVKTKPAPVKPARAEKASTNRVPQATKVKKVVPSVKNVEPSSKTLTPIRSSSKVVEVIAKPVRKSRRRKRKKAAVRPEKQLSPIPVLARSADKIQKTVSKNAGTPSSRKESKVEPVKARRVRVPKDFAQQYGGAEKQKRAVENSETKRARRDAVLRQKMRDAMEVGDDLIARLRRAGMIGGDAEETKNGHSPRRTLGSGVMRRPRKWEARCGKCGGKSLFKTQAGLCAKCGAIMVRE